MLIKPQIIKVKDKVLYHPPIPSNMIVVIDTREQLPYMFSGCRILSKKLNAGDYSIEGWEDKISIERKSAADLYGSITQNRDRFERELEVLQDYKFKGLVIEEEELDLLCPEMYGRYIDCNSIYGSIISFEIKYGLNVYYGNRKRCENKILNWFIYWMKMYGNGVNIGMEI